MATPYFAAGTRNYSTQTYGATNNLAVTVPASAQVGDIVLALWNTGGGITISAKPSAFTTLSQSGYDAGIYYLLIDDAADIKSYTWTSAGVFNDGADLTQVIYAVYRGFDLADPIDVYGLSEGYSLFSPDISCPSVTATAARGALVCLGACSAAIAGTPPTGMTERYETVSGGLTYCMDKEVSASGAQGVQDIDTGSTAVAYWAGASIILNPAASGNSLFFGSPF